MKKFDLNNKPKHRLFPRRRSLHRDYAHKGPLFGKFAKTNFFGKLIKAIGKFANADFLTKNYKRIGIGALALAVIAVAAIWISGSPKQLQEASAAKNTETSAQSIQPSTQTLPAVTDSPSPSESSGVAPSESLSPSSLPSPSPSPSPSKSKAPSVDWNKILKEFEVKAKKYYSGYSSNHYKYTEDEVKMLATVVFLEARGESYTAQVAVGNVVMNRVLASGYPGRTIKEVVTRPNQFAYNPSVVPNRECINVARDILDFEVWTVPQNIYYFRVTSSTGNWGSHKLYQKIGATTFYSASYAGRRNLKTIPEQLFKRVYKWPQYGCEPAKRVRKIQIMLVELGFGKFKTDGYFGLDTKEALMKFQKSKGIKADGVAGPSTIKALIKKYGVDKYLKL